MAHYPAKCAAFNEIVYSCLWYHIMYNYQLLLWNRSKHILVKIFMNRLVNHIHHLNIWLHFPGLHVCIINNNR